MKWFSLDYTRQGVLINHRDGNRVTHSAWARGEYLGELLEEWCERYSRVDRLSFHGLPHVSKPWQAFYVGGDVLAAQLAAG